MKKAIFALAIFSCAHSAVYAGPESYSGKEMKQVAPMPPACPTWGGFYVGGFGGYTYAATNLDPNLNGDWDGPSATDPLDKDVIDPTAAHDLSTSGAQLGGLIGYNYQWNKWVFGLEAAGGYMWLRDSDNTGVFDVAATGDDYRVSSSFKTHYLATFGGRIGYAFCRWLPYVTGGLALGDLNFQQTITQSGLFFHDIGRTNDTHTGWMLGGGLEYAVTNHWRVRGQYQYVDLGSHDYHATGTTPFEGYTADPSFQLHEHNVSVALIYGF